MTLQVVPTQQTDSQRKAIAGPSPSTLFEMIGKWARWSWPGSTRHCRSFVLNDLHKHYRRTKMVMIVKAVAISGVSAVAKDE
jgi:hypothetical protein